MTLWLPQCWKTHFLRVELWLACIITAAVSGLAVHFHWFMHIDAALKNNHSAVYGTLASIFGALLGFVITSISIVLGLVNDPRFSLVRKSDHYGDLWGIFTASIKAFGAATAASLAGLILDRDAHPQHVVLVLCFGTVVLATLRLLRAIWVLEYLVRIAMKPPPSGDSST